ncbi:MAG: SUMF1/EgtB/PvdO family nonheme iron enzyme [Treponema sp.]|nr:SUMF1/EgtB/PvdO family nonheme iron enzyme [Treponema sp.]
MVYFQVPRQRVGSEITVSLLVKKANGFILCSGRKTMRVTEGCQFSVAMRDVPEEMVFVEGNGSIPDLYVCPHEVTQWEYERYCFYGADRPSDAYGVGPNFPVYYVSFFDAIVYCNKRSMAEGFTPCYSIGGSTNPVDWGTVPTSYSTTWNNAECDNSADGYRLPTLNEWDYAWRGGLANDSHYYPGSNTKNDVA